MRKRYALQLAILISIAFTNLHAQVISPSLYAIQGSTIDKDLPKAAGYSVTVIERNNQDSNNDGIYWDYFSPYGLDMSATFILGKLPKDKNIVLFGNSLGGVVSRRIVQEAAMLGQNNIKGYIAQSSPLMGCRLANPAWFWASLAAFGFHCLGDAGFIVMCQGVEMMLLDTREGSVRDSSILIFNALDEEAKKIETQFATHLTEEQRLLPRAIERASRDRALYRNLSKELIVRNLGLPILDALFGDSVPRGYWDAMVSAGENNIKDLDPLGDFMTKILNYSAGNSAERGPSIKRAYIETNEGNIFNTGDIWSTVGPYINNMYQLRNTYWANGKKYWWQIAYWWSLAAVKTVQIGLVENIPNSWSCVMTGTDQSWRHDGFVPYSDTYWGHEMSMHGPTGQLRDWEHDRTYQCPSVSHVDYNASSLTILAQMQGRNGSRSIAADQLLTETKKAFDFMLKPSGL